MGSPPRVREVFLPVQVLLPYLGITPACAGSIKKIRSCGESEKDHPRVCGKYSFADGLQWIGPGSPPRVREVFLQYQKAWLPIGITPACAGSITEIGQLHQINRDHPRVCGKYLYLLRWASL